MKKVLAIRKKTDIIIGRVIRHANLCVSTGLTPFSPQGGETYDKL